MTIAGAFKQAFGNAAIKDGSDLDEALTATGAPQSLGFNNPSRHRNMRSESVVDRGVSVLRELWPRADHDAQGFDSTSSACHTSSVDPPSSVGKDMG